MKITLNGKNTDLSGEMTVSELLTAQNLHGKPVAVELNGLPVLPQQFPTQALGQGDQIEIIVIAAGG